MIKRLLFPSLCLLIYLFSVEVVLGQGSNGDFPNYDPPSPEASALGKFIEHPVSTFTGTPQIEIPLFEIKTGRIKLPISLKYHASGIGVDEVASRIGAGWVLDAGGIITRTVKGYPDDVVPINAFKINGYFNSGGSLPTAIEDLGTTDTQPDVHFYSLGNKSGEIYFSSPTHPVVVNKDPIKVNGPYNGNNRFIITDDDGLVYTFAASEQTRTLSGRYLYSYSSSWYLTNISDPISGKSVDFYYRTDMPTLFYDMKKNWSPSPYCQGDFGGSSGLSAQNTLSNVRVLQKIVYSGGYIEFKADQGRNDYSGDKAYTEINQYTTVSGYPVLKKGFNLGHYETHNVSGQYAENFRLYLESVQEKGSNGILLPPYNFFYKNRNLLPQRGSAQQDIWGYYNANGASGDVFQLPKVYLNYNFWISSQHACLPFDNIYHTGGTILSGLDRSTNILTVDDGTLNKIVYPTKGYTTYTFESHEFDSYQTGGIRIKEIDDYGSNNQLLLAKKYTYSGGFLGGPYPQVGYPTGPSSNDVFRFYNNQTVLGSCQGSYVGYATVLVQKIGASGDNGTVRFDYSTDIDVPGIFTLVTNGCTALRNLSVIRDNSCFPFFEMESRERRRGLLLSEEYLDKNFNSVKATKYNYTLISEPAINVTSVYSIVGSNQRGDPELYTEFTEKRSINAEKAVLSLKTESLNKGSGDTRDVHAIISDSTSYEYTEGDHNGQYLRKETRWDGRANYDINYRDDYRTLPCRSSQIQYTYPFDYAPTAGSGMMGKMVNMNYLSPVISKISSRTPNGGASPVTYYTDGMITNFSHYLNGDDQFILPSKVFKLKLPNTLLQQNSSGNNGLVEVNDPEYPGALYEKKVDYLAYDEFGNPTTVLQDQKYTLLNWGDVGDRLYFKSVASNPAGTAGVTTSYDYDEMDRLKTVIDANDRNQYYEYDAFGRLTTIRDKDNHILKSYCYNFAGQGVGCQIPGQTIYARLETGNYAQGFAGNTYSSSAYVVVSFYSDANCTTRYTLTAPLNFNLVTTQYYSSSYFPPNVDVYSSPNVAPAGVSSFPLGTLTTEDDEFYGNDYSDYYYIYSLSNSNGNFVVEPTLQ